jgi:hypothetical protein
MATLKFRIQRSGYQRVWLFTGRMRTFNDALKFGRGKLFRVSRKLVVCEALGQGVFAAFRLVRTTGAGIRGVRGLFWGGLGIGWVRLWSYLSESSVRD